MSSGPPPPARAVASEPATYHIRREWIDDYRGRSAVIAVAGLGLLVVGFFAPPEGNVWWTVFPIWAVAAHHYRVSVRDARYRFEISPFGVRTDTSTDWIPWLSVVALRDRPTYNRIDLLDPRGRAAVRLHYEVPEFDDLLAQVVLRMVWKTDSVPSRFVRPWNADRIGFAIVLAVVVGFGGAAWFRGAGWRGLVLAAIGVLLGFAEWFQISKTEIGPQTLTWKRGWKLHEIDLRTASAVRLAVKRSKYGSSLEVLVEGPDGPTDVRPTDADPFAVYRAVVTGLRLAGSNAAEGPQIDTSTGGSGPRRVRKPRIGGESPEDLGLART